MYSGLCEALQFTIDSDIDCSEIYIRGDAEVVINQLKGFYRIRSQSLFQLHSEVMDNLDWLNRQYVDFEHIDLSYNAEADGLANDSIRIRSSSTFWD